MSKGRVTCRIAVAFLLSGIVSPVGAVLAQPSSASPPASPQTTPDVATPPGGIARGVVPPPRDVDPAIVTPPPTGVNPSMPVIKPPTGAK